MFFDKRYIELICSPDILDDEHHDMTVEEAMSRFNEQGLRYEFEERAAILEYDGGLTRENAEKQALREIDERMTKIFGTKTNVTRT
jgi:hypothetical protein